MIPFLKPELSDQGISACIDSMKSGWLAFGPYTDKAESLLANLFESDNFLITSSCTASLQMALMLGNIGPGDEVITTPLTWVATSNVIIYQGAKIVFADVNPETGLIDENEIFKKITDRTRAIIAVDLYGLMFDYGGLRKKLAGSNILIIEDAAHAIGSQIGSKKPGQDSDYCCFSFHAAKNITSGQGGGLICRDSAKVKEAKLIRRDGVSGSNAQRQMHCLGHKFDSTDFQSALLIDQIARYEDTQLRRSAVYQRYLDLFSKNENVRHQRNIGGYKHSGHMYVLWLNRPRERAGLIDHLNSKGIQVSVHYNPVHLEPYYRKAFGYAEGDFPHAEYIGSGAVSLPTYPSLTMQEQQFIADEVNCYFSKVK